MGHLGATLGTIFVEIMEDKGRKVQNGPQKWHVDVEWHVQCISFRFVSGPKGPINRKYTFFPRILLVQGGPRTPTERTTEQSRPLSGYLGAILGLLWGHFGYFEVTLV